MLRKTAVTVGALAALALAVLASARDRRPTQNPLYDVVAVGRGSGKVVFATLAGPPGSYRWRFRTIPLMPETERVESILLSRSGTKALVVFSDGSSRTFDLTEKLSGIGPRVVQVAQHRLPGQLFPLARAGQVCLVNDAGETSACRSAARAAVHEDGRVLYANSDGSLALVAPGREQAISLAYRLPGGEYQLLAGQNGGQHDFVLLLERNSRVRLVDPVSGKELSAYDGWELAALRVLLESSVSRSGSQAQIGDSTLRAVISQLIAQSAPETYSWSFFLVKPEIALYAPVLEFAAEEPAYPSDTGIWETIAPMARGSTREAYRQAYQSMGEDRWRHCKVYFRQASYPGSWLLEYWYYYPFDEGKPHPHIHDSEHIFIEVDKLGGSVRSVLASAHGSFAPNNNYSTFLRNAQPVRLPLFAMVEFEKHAMSPDINHSGTFTRGVDVNLYRDRYEVWGVRDLGAKKGHLMEPYRPFMTLPRRKQDRSALENFSSFFPGIEVEDEKSTCGLLPFPEQAPCKDCDVATPAAAETHLTAHGDARSPRDIYKPWVLPWHEVRVGLAFFDHGGNSTQFYTAYVSELRHLLRRHSPVPGRLALEFMWSPASQTFTFPSNGQTISVRLSSATYFGARYERFLTNTQGFYGGVTPLFRHVATEVVDSGAAPAGARWQYDSMWYRVGYILELPSHKKGNMTHHLGVMFNGRTARFEWRVSLGLFRRHGRNSFGIRESDPNPYE